MVCMLIGGAAEASVDGKAEAVRFLKLMDHRNNVIRLLPSGRQLYGDWTELGRLAEEALAESLYGNVYVVGNDISDETFNAFLSGVGDAKAICDHHIERRRHFLVDGDPARFYEGRGPVSATEEERAWVEAACETVVMLAAMSGFAEPVLVDSGNGFQAHFAIDLPNDEESAALIKSVLKAFAALIDSDKGHIDTTVGNASRLVRLPGTVNRKGPTTPDRPHRMARILSAPEDGVLKVTGKEVLQAFVDRVGQSKRTCPDASRNLTHELGTDLDPETVEGVVADVITYLREQDAPPLKEPRRDERKIILPFAYCPFRGPQHADGDPAVLVYTHGGIGFKCFHAKCAESGWDALQSLLGRQFISATLARYAGEHRTSIRRRYSDPLILAETHYEQSRLLDGGPSLVFLQGEMYRYVQGAGWRPIVSRELQAPVRDTIQRVYDAHFLATPGFDDYPRAVRTADINNTVKALESIAYFQADPAVSPPFWLTPAYQSDPLDLLVLRNGILDLKAWVEGREHFFPSTSQLFTQAVGTYDFDPDQGAAPHWFGFLDSLGQDPEWVALLQQIMGCSLCAGYDLQKIFMLFGPPRCGKGTITRVLEATLGPQNVCSPNLIDFAKAFGLEQALGTRLAIVPEVAFPPRDTQQIVAALKAISGGDLVTVDRKHIKNIPVRLRIKIMLVTNNFIALPDNSKALPSRVIPLRFTRSFLGKEDTELGRRLLAEQPAILNWSLEGFRTLVEQNGQFTLPESSLELMDQLQIESAPLQAFIREACVLDPRKGVYKQSLYESYKAWMKANDPERPPLEKGDFNRELMTAVSHVTAKRPKNRECHQSTYTVVPTAHDLRIESDRPEVWVGICCRLREG